MDLPRRPRRTRIHGNRPLPHEWSPGPGDRGASGTLRGRWRQASRYFWLYGRENVPVGYLAFDALRTSNLKTARASAIKEQLRDLWDQPTLEDGQAWWTRWFWWASHSRLEPVKKVARMVKAHLPNVLTYFTHRITSATNEAINGVIKTLTKRAYGFSNFLNFRTEVLFHCGKLQLYPASGSLTPS